MGSIIREDTEGEPSTVLTETGKGGLLSKGYLRDAPAGDYVGDGEAAVFVLADAESGVERERAGDRTRITPGKGYRAITVVTDRRVIVLVGDGDDGGDKRVTLPFVEISDVAADGGALVVEMSSGVTWRCHADATGVDDVAAYVDAAATAWHDVEDALDDVKRSIVSATAHRDEGVYDEAFEAIGAAREGVADARHRAASFEAEWGGRALAHRVASLRDRTLRTAAQIHVGHARSRVDDGEAHWREGAYERAHDAFDAARESYEEVRSMESRHRRAVEDVDEALDRLDRRVERLDDAPLRRAIDADRRAADLDPGNEALDALAEARDRYATVLDLEADTDERRFAGDRDRIREQREDVTDRYVATAREVGTDALAAGEWYCGSGQLSLAVEELERAATVLDRGLSVAATERPAVAEDLRIDLARTDELLEDVREDLADEPSSQRPANGTDVGNGDETAETVESGDADQAVEPAVETPVESAVEPDVDPDDVPAEEVGNDGVAERNDCVDERSDGVAGRNDAVDEERDDAGQGVAAGDGDDGTTAGRPADSVFEQAVEDGADAGLDPADGARTAVQATLRDLGPSQFDRVVTAVVEAMGWRPEPTASAAVDFLARRAGDESAALAITTFPHEGGEPIAPETIRECAMLGSSVPGVDEVMIVTARPLPDATMIAAREDDVRVLDVEYLASALQGPEAADVAALVPTTGD